MKPVAATDSLGIIVSIVLVDEGFWAASHTDCIRLLESRGFDFYDIGPINSKEAERNIASWGEWGEWVSTLQPA